MGGGGGEILVAGSCVKEGEGRRECYTLTGHEAGHTPASLIGEHHHRVQWCIVKCYCMDTSLRSQKSKIKIKSKIKNQVKNKNKNKNQIKKNQIKRLPPWLDWWSG